jgi:hypothetical protein
MSTNRQSLPQPDGIVLQPFPSRKTIELYMEAVHDGERVCTKAMYINPKDRMIFEYMAGEDFKPTGGSQNSRHEAHIGDYRRDILVHTKVDVPPGKMLVVSSPLHDGQVLLEWCA